MSFIRLYSACLQGAQVVPVQIEVDIQPGLPIFHIIGLPDKRIDEARERVKSAIKNSGFAFPLGKITINLSPSNIPKQGTGFDLGIALGILQAAGKMKSFSKPIWVLGELSLDGYIQPFPQLVAVLIEALRQKVAGCIIPECNLAERQLVHECPVRTAGSLAGLGEALKQGLTFQKAQPTLQAAPVRENYLFDQIVGQAQAKRVLEIALAGRHHLFLSGPPGSGKTMLATAASQLLPLLKREEYLQVAQIYSAALQPYSIEQQFPPYRAPHHTVTRTSLYGGGNQSKPGEISLAHRGILFLDEFPELKRETREVLRQPMQDKRVSLHRQGQKLHYPADCLIIAAQNNCPCGLAGVEGEYCRCTASELARYQRAVSQPLLDRFDLFCQLPKLDLKEWKMKVSPQGKQVAERIARCHLYQAERKVVPILREELFNYVARVTRQLYISGRGLQKVVEVARTIADLEEKREIEKHHLQEALLYRHRSLLG